MLLLRWLPAALVLTAALSGATPAPAQTASPTPTVTGNADRGAYLATSVAMCVQCHSGRDEAGNLVDAQRFAGGRIPAGPPWARPGEWAFSAPRIAGLSGYSTAQGITLLTRGRTRSGRTPRAPMPAFRMSEQDAADVVAFLQRLR